MSAVILLINKIELLMRSLATVFGFFLMLGLAGPADAQLTVQMDKAKVPMGFFYHGSSIELSGLSEQDADIIVKISSPEERATFGKKGKKAGFLWMNSGELIFEKTPQLYHLYSTKNVENILNEHEQDANLIGYAALIRRINITPAADENEKMRWANEFLRFKQTSGLYTVSAGSVAVQKNGTAQKYFLRISWPYQALPGKYTVTVFSARNKRVIEKAETVFSVEQVGLVARLSAMAKEQGALYGAISVVVALAAGFGTGIIFKKGGGAH